MGRKIGYQDIYIYISPINPGEIGFLYVFGTPQLRVFSGASPGASCGSGQAMFSFRMGVVQVMKVWLRTAAAGFSSALAVWEHGDLACKII
jgi:hypothetical protein